MHEAHGALDWQSADLEHLAIDRAVDAGDTVLVAALKRAYAETRERRSPKAGFDNQL